jgi:hypothetical protein
MMHLMLCRTAVAALLLLVPVSAPRAVGSGAQADAPRIVAIADIHGSLGGLLEILRAARLIDAQDRWAGGQARVVQTGDFTDRGDEVRQVMDLLMRLESEARSAGGRVDVLFGNHEGMNVLNDFRDVSPGAYAAFADSRSEDRRRRAFDAYAAVLKRRGETADRNAWMAAHPPGFVEYVEAMAPNGRYGRWIRGRKVVLQVGDTIFMHAGLSPDTQGSLEEVNRGVEREIRSWDEVVATLERQRLITRTMRLGEIVNAAQVEIGRILLAQKTGAPPGDHVTSAFIAALQHLSSVETWALLTPSGPLWYRGLATAPESERPALDSLLRRHKAERFIVGHTPQLPGRVNTRFDGRVVLADTGMLSGFYRGGRPSAVEIQGGRLTAIYPSERQALDGAP